MASPTKWMVWAILPGFACSFVHCSECAAEVTIVFKAPLEFGGLERWKLSSSGQFIAAYPRLPLRISDRSFALCKISGDVTPIMLRGHYFPLQVSDNGHAVILQSSQTGEVSAWERTPENGLERVPLDLTTTDAVSLSPDGSSVAFSSPDGIFIRNFRSQTATLLARKRILGRMQFAADGTHLVGTSSSIYVVNVKEGIVTFSHELPRHWRAECTLSRNGEILGFGMGLMGEAGRNGRTIEVWNTRTKKRVDQFVVSTTIQSRPILSPTGSRIAVVGYPNHSTFLIRVYDVGIGKVTIHELKSSQVLDLGDVEAIPEVAFVSDEEVVFATGDGMVRRWRLGSEYKSSLLDQK